MSVAAASPVQPPPVTSADLPSVPFEPDAYGPADDYVGQMAPTASGSGVQTLWHPPEPSMDTLPVDASKTDPKPAYYKLQFGDDYTGFSYYVRTLAVIIGRKVVCIPLRAVLMIRRSRSRRRRQISDHHLSRRYRLSIWAGTSTWT